MELREQIEKKNQKGVKKIIFVQVLLQLFKCFKRHMPSKH